MKKEAPTTMGPDGIATGFAASFAANGKKTALRFFRNGNPETELTYADLDADTGRVASFFSNVGVGKGDRVILISGGENISPKEVETVINQMDGVLESVVVDIPDEKWGEKVVAAVKCRPGKEIDAAEIQRFCRESVHDWKTPREFRFVEKIPKNRMGKVLNDGVRRLFSK